MNTQPNKENAGSVRRSWLRSFPGRLLRIAVTNWPWKLLALFLAVCLWAGLITQDPTLTRERVFTDVPLSVTGADSLRRNGLIVVSGIENADLDVRLRVEVPQREYNTVTYTNYNPRVDLSRITEPGEQAVKLAATSTVAYGTVQDISPATISVVVDEYVTNYRVPVSVSTTGSYPEGFHGSTFSLDPSVVAVSGPRSVVDQIARIYVDFDASALEARAGTYSFALPMRFVDREGSDVTSDQLEVTSSGVVLRSIIVRQSLYPIRELPVSDVDILSGEPARGYHVTGVTLSPSVIRAAGDETLLGDLESLFADSTVSVSGARDSFTASVRIKKPAELEHLSASTVSVAVTVEPVIISSSLPSVRLLARGTGSGLRTGLSDSTVSAVVTGPQLLVETLRSSNVTAYVDVSGLKPGEYLLPVQFHVEDADAEDLTFVSTPGTVTVTVFD